MAARIFAVFLSAIVGGLLSLVVWGVWPHRYVSTAIVADGSAIDEGKLQAIARKRSLPFQTVKDSLKIRSAGGSRGYEISFTSADPGLPPAIVADAVSGVPQSQAPSPVRDLHPRMSRCGIVGVLAGVMAALISLRR